jgi:hypothetical protein
MFGTLVHQMIEAHANGDDAFTVLDSINLKDAKMFAAEKAEYGEIIEDVGLIMAEYFDHWDSLSDMSYIRKSKRSAEHKFEIEIRPGILWNGKIDALGKTRNGLRWLVEHKTFKRKPNDDDRWRNLQSVSYFRAIDVLGWPAVDGTCWDYIWSKPPIKPSLLKDGKLSRKKLDTLPSMVARAIKEYGLDRKEYTDYKKSTEANRHLWFQRIHTPVNREVVNDVFDDFVSTVQEMADLHGKVKDRNIERHCTWCDFEPLCRASMQGLDIEYVKEREYEASKKHSGDEESHYVSFEDLEG